MNYQKAYEKWLNEPYFDEEFKSELRALSGQEKEIEDRFFQDLAFGTGGMRGVIGAGRNRINKYIIRRATQGFANYIKDEGTGPFSVVIAHDSRRQSKEFAEETALVMAANGICAYLFSSLRSTPELSYAVRSLRTSGGVVITASHNPPEYNGYKIYGDDGAQLIPKDADKVVKAVQDIENFKDIKYVDRVQAIEMGLLKEVNEEQDSAYIDMIMGHQKRTLSLQEKEALKLVYTPLHGTGGRVVKAVLENAGYKNWIPVKEQMIPDENFSTVALPNPEDPEAFKMALSYAKNADADIVIATDPDSDRLGVMSKYKDGYRLLNGNQTGALLVDYILSSMESIPKNAVIINTVVTSELGKEIARSYGVKTLTTLTGFKYIGQKIRQFEKDKSHAFIMGYEESYGYLDGTDVRDKDAVVSALLVAEMSAFYKAQGKTLCHRLEEIFEKYGAYGEDLISVKMEGKTGVQKINHIMEGIRKAPLKEISGHEVTEIIDYANDDTGLPSSNVIKCFFSDRTWFAIRPSGTEPKMKIYLSAKGKSEDETKEKIQEIKANVLKRIEDMEK